MADRQAAPILAVAGPDESGDSRPAGPLLGRSPLTTPVVRYYPPVPQQPVRHNACAILGATLGSVALAISMLPVLGMLSWVLAPISLLLSAVGLLLGFLRHAGRMGALWGLANSTLALAVCWAWVLLARLI